MGILEVYTDGGCRGNGKENNIGAWGVYLKYGSNEKKIGGYEYNTTNNIMELTACIKGLEAIKNKNLEIVVHLDSQYVYSGITEWIKNWKKNGFRTAAKKPILNRELWIQLDELTKTFPNLTFKKVAGHADNEGNNIADLICNETMDKYQKK